MPARFRIEAPRAASLVLAEAVLIYREAQHNATHAYASIHRVDLSAGRPVILAGKPMSPRAARRLARDLAQQVPAAASYLDGRLLYAADALRVWWLPAGHRHIAFRCAELGERGDVVPHPALVFAVSTNGWCVWACKDNTRPTPETRLFRAPYFNVSDMGVICQGSTIVPTGEARHDIDAWTDAFFGSYFSHPNGARTVRHQHGAYAFWKDMLNAPPARFPARVLIAMNRTLGDMIAHMGGDDD